MKSTKMFGFMPWSGFVETIIKLIPASLFLNHPSGVIKEKSAAGCVSRPEGSGWFLLHPARIAVMNVANRIFFIMMRGCV